MIDDETKMIDDFSAIIQKLEDRVKLLDEENAQLKTHIRTLNDAIDSKNRTINKLQYDSWDDCYDSFRDR